MRPYRRAAYRHQCSEEKRQHLPCVLVALALVAPAVAQDEAALIQKRNQVREMAREALVALYEIQPGAVFPAVYLYQLADTGPSASITLSGTKFFRDPDLH